MTRQRLLKKIGFLGGITFFAAASFFGYSNWGYSGWKGAQANDVARREYGDVAILTSLPIFSPEATSVADALAAKRSPENVHPLGAYWTMLLTPEIYDDPIAAFSAKPDLVILAQPRPFAPDQLAAFDAWVRAGGKAIMFADPALFWPSIFPIGDPRRPEGATLMSPLFAHWGLEQYIDDDQPDGVWSAPDHIPEMMVVQAGYFTKKQDASAQCTLLHRAMIASCQIGSGKAILVADADMLQSDFYPGVVKVDQNNLPENGNWRSVQFLLELIKD